MKRIPRKHEKKQRIPSLNASSWPLPLFGSHEAGSSRCKSHPFFKTSLIQYSTFTVLVQRLLLRSLRIFLHKLTPNALHLLSHSHSLEACPQTLKLAGLSKGRDSNAKSLTAIIVHVGGCVCINVEAWGSDTGDVDHTAINRHRRIAKNSRKIRQD